MSSALLQRELLQFISECSKTEQHMAMWEREGCAFSVTFSGLGDIVRSKISGSVNATIERFAASRTRRLSLSSCNPDSRSPSTKAPDSKAPDKKGLPTNKGSLTIRNLIFRHDTLDLVRPDAVSETSVCLDGHALNDGVNHRLLDLDTPLRPLTAMKDGLVYLISVGHFSIPLFRLDR